MSTFYVLVSYRHCECKAFWTSELHTNVSLMTMTAPGGQREAAAFATHSTLSPFAVSPQTYLATHPDPRSSYIATGAIVFDRSESHNLRVLLLQRSCSDSMPGRWEIPGGGCDDDDETILHGVARELREETGIVAVYIGPAIGEGEFFTSRSGKKIRKFTFVIETENNAYERSTIKLDPEEHQRHLWASSQEIEAHTSGSMKLDFTTPDLKQTVLAAFSMSHNELPFQPKDLPAL